MKYYTLTAEDVGKAHIRAFGRVWPVVDFIGRVLPIDVGKRVYKRAGILQVENQEQYSARMATSTTQRFDDDVAWLEFLANWERRAGGPLKHFGGYKRLMRIAFDWARTNMRSSKSEPGRLTHCDAHGRLSCGTCGDTPRCQCQCSNNACFPCHCITPNPCGAPAVLHLFRVTVQVHETPLHDGVPTEFCEPCGDKALESGAFCVGDDLLEPHHGPGCIERMYADAGVGEEGDQS